jgi:NADH dehydrogenase FAD-containing subunit
LLVGVSPAFTQQNTWTKPIARHADVEVVLISDQDFTLFTQLLQEVAAGDVYPATLSIPSDAVRNSLP